MRVKLNSNLYSKFTPEQLVMGDKAEELGFVWDRTKYPTPAWAIDIEFIGRPLFGIHDEIWYRELVLWSLDCAEVVLPIWERYAASVNIDSSRARTGVDLARKYANRSATKQEIHELRRYTSFLSIFSHAENAELPGMGGAVSYALRATMRAVLASNSLSTRSSVITANVNDSIDNAVLALARQNRISAATKEAQRWPLQLLAHRIDQVAPWRLSP